MMKMFRIAAALLAIGTVAHAQPVGQLPSGQLWGNSTAARAVASPTTVTGIIDRAISSTQGVVLTRNATVWIGLAPGTAGLPLLSAGAGANLAYGILGLSGGGCNAALTASNGGILYSTTTACAILAGTATAGQIVRSGASAAPAWSTATYPATVTVNRLLWASSTNVIADLATGNNGVLVTDGSGVPSISSTIPSATQDNITRTGTLVSGATGAGFTVALSTSTITGTLACARLPALAGGDVTSSAGSCVTVLVNIPTATPMAGSLLATNIVAPGTPASGKTSLYVDSTDKRLHDKNDAGTIGTTAVANAGTSNNFFTAMSAAGVFSTARPTCANLSDSGVFCSGTDAANLSGTVASARISGSYTGITGVGTLTAGATGAGFTVALTTSTVTGNLPVANQTSIADQRVIGNVSGGTASAIALTPTQLTTLVNAFTTTLNGSVPNPGTVASKFLRDDGTWQAVAGAGTVTSATIAAGTGIGVSGTCTITTTGTCTVTNSGLVSITTQTFTSSGTYTPTSGTIYANAICTATGAAGGAGAGGGFGGGGGGGAGETAMGTFSAATLGASKTVTIGAAGSDTTFGALLTAKSGGVGAASAGGTAGVGGNGGSGGTSASGSPLIVGGDGGAGSIGISGVLNGAGGIGGASYWGGGGKGGPEGNAGAAGRAYGAGGGGGSASGNAGGAAMTGVCVIQDFVGG